MNVRKGWVRDKGNVWMAIPADVNPLSVPCLVVTDYEADAHYLLCVAHAGIPGVISNVPCCEKAERRIVVPLPVEPQGAQS